MEEKEGKEKIHTSMVKYSFHDGAFIKARTSKECWMQKSTYFLFLFFFFSQ